MQSNAATTGHDAFVRCGCRAAPCAHARGELACEPIGDGPALRALQGALHQAGAEHAPTLLAALPGGRGGAPDAARALGELARFRAHVGQTRGLFLVDADTGATLHEYDPARWGEFAWSAEVVLGFDPQGFFARRTGGGQRFRAMQFEQHAPPERDEAPAGAEFVNTINNTRYVCPMSLSDAHGRAFPRRIKVEMRMRRPDDSAYLIEALERLLHASAQSGNPIEWR